MIISCWFLPCVLLLVQGAIVRCSDLQDPSSVNVKSSKQLPTETDTYEYHHPPLPELNEKRSRKEKSVDFNEEHLSSTVKSRTRSTRRRARPKATTASLEIPVQVIYDTEPTTVRSYTSTSKSTISPLKRTTRISVQRRRLASNTNKKIDIRQIAVEESNNDNYESNNKANVTKNTQNSDKEIINTSSSTEFPKRSRGSYFQKRTGPPAPRVKIVEEKNFVYAHSGNFHYSFLGGDGTKVSSEGSLKSYDNNKTGEAVSGSVFYTDKDGNDISLSYTADENGYRPIGAHLPTPPPLPPAIARALKYIADKSTPSPLAKNE